MKHERGIYWKEEFSWKSFTRLNFLSFLILDPSQEAAEAAEALVESEHHDWSLHSQVVLPVLPGPSPLQRVGPGVGPLPAGGGVHHVRHRLHHTQVHTGSVFVLFSAQ